MAVGRILTMGLGSYSEAKYLPTLGYGDFNAVITGPFSASILAGQIQVDGIKARQIQAHGIQATQIQPHGTQQGQIA